MKKVLFSILLAIILGGVFAIYVYKKMMSDSIPAINTNDKNSIYAIQIGVFNNYDNAKEMAENYGALIVGDNDKYRVYIALCNKTLSKIKDYYDSIGLSYYVKTIEVNSSFSNTLDEYEEMISVSDDSLLKDIIKSILKEYEKTIT